MIITQAPMRISLFGGGTDIPNYFLENGGEVLSFAIDKYSYVNLRRLPPYFDHTIRLTYSKLETCSDPSVVAHPLIRVALQHHDLNNIELHHDSDVPGMSGLGSSSSFGVAMSLAMSSLRHQSASPYDLASTVIDWERNILREAGGYQDQVAAAYGGINVIKFTKSSMFDVHPLPVSIDFINAFLSRLVLAYVPIKRLSHNFSIANSISSPEISSSLDEIKGYVSIARDLLLAGDFDSLGNLLDHTWRIKRAFRSVTNDQIDQLYCKAISAGALGGKLLGAGGGGFMIFLAKEGQRDQIVDALFPTLTVPFNLDFAGARILHFSGH